MGNLVRRFAPAHRYAVITDSNVGPIYGIRAIGGFPPGSADLFTVPAGETNKTRESWSRLTDDLVAAGFGRDSAVVALGGGMVGDLAGFVAGTFMRGVPVVQVPTTLLGMIDASIGGKTGVDTPAGKNLVGLFHPPAAVVSDPETLGTLALDSLRTGFAEAIKHGVIADSGYFGFVTRELPMLLAPGGAGSDTLTRVIVRSIEIKAGIVARDERERGLRKVLNFGHTIGHALEALSGYDLAHGEAVAIGMALESALAERAGIAEDGTSEAIRNALSAAGLPARRPQGMASERIIDAMRADKKARRGEIEYALPCRIGAMAGSSSGWAVTVADDIVREVLT
ncbi:MAG: 3-dehydroquinate synthase [Gemmatimonadota bacterium]|nr:3-dehydroquinate synthase [Gemmatimonadota bacterium]